MLVNFCDPRLRPEIKCSVISTDGYEASNLITDAPEGFLAYSCIRPPVHMDITFLCDVQIRHIIIRPAVRSHKSTGFQLYSLNASPGEVIPYDLLSTAFLKPSDVGLLFHSTDVDPNDIPVPMNFLKRYIRSCRQSRCTHGVRLTICKTDGSLPALGSIEIWGTVSLRCGEDVARRVHGLWSGSSGRQVASPLPMPKHEVSTTGSTSVIENKQDIEVTPRKLEMPESFLDALTWELMTQPIILPNGSVIDQTTLEKHGQHEAIWGRPLSDPFTGIPFSEHRKPVMASALKSRIDKFLLTNCDSEEIKSIPRVLGYDATSAIAADRRIIKIPKCVLNAISVKRTAVDVKTNRKTSGGEMTTDDSAGVLRRPKEHCHRLPAIIAGPVRATAKIKARLRRAKEIPSSFKPLLRGNESYSNNNNESEMSAASIDNLLDSETLVLSSIRRFDAPEKVELHNISSTCKCCDNDILYKLPCKHVICRKALLSIADNRCNTCGFLYRSSEIERVHGEILNS